jgi:hypothetical protein
MEILSLVIAKEVSTLPAGLGLRPLLYAPETRAEGRKREQTVGTRADVVDRIDLEAAIIYYIPLYEMLFWNAFLECFFGMLTREAAMTAIK